MKIFKGESVVSYRRTKDDRKYFHEAEQSEIDELLKIGGTIESILKKYRQPDWCSYPNALEGLMGCWSLVDLELRTKISEDFCKDCEYFREVKSVTIEVGNPLNE